MTIINPVSDLKDYSAVLSQVEAGQPVFLTVEGRGRYIIRDIADEDEYEKTKAMLELMMELNAGRRSAEEKGYIPSATVRAHLRQRLAAK